MRKRLERKNRNLKKKGQIVIYDFLFGFITFIVILTLITLMWFKASARIQLDSEQETKLKIARDLSAIITQTPGNPPRWELNDTVWQDSNFTIGLANDNNVLSKYKLVTFITMHSLTYDRYEDIKSMFKLGMYEYYIKIRDKESNVIYTVGTAPGEELSVTIARKVIIDGEINTFEFTIY